MCLIPLIASANVAESPVTAISVGDVGIVTKTSETTECSCVKIARALGVPIPFKTNAEDLVPNSPPTIGGLILLRYGTIAHVAVLEGFEGGFQVAEGHFKKGPCEVTHRTIDFNDSHIIGFVVF